MLYEKYYFAFVLVIVFKCLNKNYIYIPIFKKGFITNLLQFNYINAYILFV